MIEYFGIKLKDFYISQLLLKKATEGKFKGKLPNLSGNREEVEELIRNDDQLNNFFIISYSNLNFQTMIDFIKYPKTREIFSKEFFMKMGKNVTEFNNYLETSSFGIFPFGKYQKIVFDRNVSIEHPDDMYNAITLKFLNYDSALYNLSIKWCDIVEKYKEYTENVEYIEHHKENIKKLCFEIYYLFVNIVPYFRGSATASKVLLNACLSAFGLRIVRERAEYHAQADWFAFAADNFDDFYSKIDDIFQYY